MSLGRVVLVTFPCDQGDILRDFLDWHLDAGVDLILALDIDSTDGSREILDEYSRSRPVAWLPIPDRDMNKYTADDLFRTARDDYDADWVIHCDVDEFLCTRGPSVRDVLAEAGVRGVTTIDIPRRNLTGRPLAAGERATQVLNLRIDKPTLPTFEQQVSGELPFPFVFVSIPGHLAVKARAFESYGAGSHGATTTYGATEVSEQLYIIQYAIRGYGELEQKVRNVRAWLADNPHLPPGWGWHWRRFARLAEAGRLREDYDSQFVTPQRAAELVRDGTCAVDDSVRSWLERRGLGRA